MKNISAAEWIPQEWLVQSNMPKRLEFIRRSYLRAIFFIVLALFSVSLIVGCGERYTSEGNLLAQEISRELVNRGVCENQRDCFNKLPIYGEHGSHVHFNCYEVGQKNKLILNAVINIVVTRGMEITKGVPITIEAFPKSHEEYVKSSFSKKPIIKMEVTG